MRISCCHSAKYSARAILCILYMYMRDAYVCILSQFFHSRALSFSSFSFSIIHPTVFVAYRLSLSVGNASISHFAFRTHILWVFIKKDVRNILLFCFYFFLDTTNESNGKPSFPQIQWEASKFWPCVKYFVISVAKLRTRLNTFACSIDTNKIALDCMHHWAIIVSYWPYDEWTATVLSFHSKYNVCYMQQREAAIPAVHTFIENENEKLHRKMFHLLQKWFICVAIFPSNQDGYMVAQYLWMRLYCESTAFIPIRYQPLLIVTPTQMYILPDILDGMNMWFSSLTSCASFLHLFLCNCCSRHEAIRWCTIVPHSLDNK